MATAPTATPTATPAANFAGSASASMPRTDSEKLDNLTGGVVRVLVPLCLSPRDGMEYKLMTKSKVKKYVKDEFGVRGGPPGGGSGAFLG